MEVTPNPSLPMTWYLELSFLERFETFLVKYLRCTDGFEAAGGKTNGRGGMSSKRISGPFQERSHVRVQMSADRANTRVDDMVSAEWLIYIDSLLIKCILTSSTHSQ